MINMTERIYEHDSYCREFTAKVISCEKKDEFYYVELDKTAFFPEGGGQAADLGTLNDAEVLDVQIKNGIITHKTKTAFEINQEIFGKIDWETRFARMQSHSGEHVLSGIVHNLFDYTNVGFHMSDALMTVDFSGPLTAEDIEKVELLSNQAIYKNASITATFPSDEELEKIDYRSKIEIDEQVRIVTIDGIDCCACCAPHVAKTGEIGIIKIVDFCPNKKGTRVEMLAGINALKDYAFLNASNKQLMGVLSAKRENVADTVTKQNELIGALKSENSRISKQLAMYELNPIEINGSVYSVSCGLSYDELRFCANNLTEKGVKICILLSKDAEGNYLYVVSSEESDVKPIVSELNSTFNGKGGGKPNYAQGKLSAESEEALTTVVENLLK